MTRLIDDGLVDELRKEMHIREQEDKLPAFFLTNDQLRQLHASIQEPEFLRHLEAQYPEIIRDHYPMLFRRLEKRLADNQKDLFAGRDAQVMMTCYLERLDLMQRSRDRLDEEAKTAWLIPESILDHLNDCHQFGHVAWLFPHTIQYLVKAMNNPDFQRQPCYKYGTEECEYVARMLETFSQVLFSEGEIGLKGPALKKFCERVVTPMRNLIQIRKATSNDITDDMVARVCKTIREHRGVSDIALAGHVLNALGDELKTSRRFRDLKDKGTEPMTLPRKEYERLYRQATILDALLDDPRYQRDIRHMADMVIEDNKHFHL